MNGPSEEWLLKMAEKDDCGCTSVGGLACELGLLKKEDERRSMRLSGYHQPADHEINDAVSPVAKLAASAALANSESIHGDLVLAESIKRIVNALGIASPTPSPRSGRSSSDLTTESNPWRTSSSSGGCSSRTNPPIDLT